MQRPHQETYTPADTGAVAKVHDFLATHAAAGRGDVAPRYFLAGGGVGDQVELPAQMHQILLQVVEAMRQGLAVTISPHSRTLTTQQAADLLNISRPTLVKLLDGGEIPFVRAGTHRRVLLADILEYRDARRAQQYEALANLYNEDEDPDFEQSLADLRTARRATHARRQGQPR